MIVAGTADEMIAAPFPADRPLVVFDSDCVFCSRSMRLLVAMDRKGVFRLTSAQGPLGQTLYRQLGLPTDAFESNIVFADGRFHLKSDSVVAMAARLPWPWRVGVALRIVPRPIRDAAYDLVARRRYRIFGRRAACGLADPALMDRLV